MPLNGAHLNSSLPNIPIRHVRDGCLQRLCKHPADFVPADIEQALATTAQGALTWKAPRAHKDFTGLSADTKQASSSARQGHPGHNRAAPASLQTLTSLSITRRVLTWTPPRASQGLITGRNYNMLQSCVILPQGTLWLSFKLWPSGMRSENHWACHAPV